MECAQIEAQLLQHPLVRAAAVLANVAYITPDFAKLRTQQQLISGSASSEVVARWNKLYELTYSTGPAAPSFVGWNSIYTRKPIPEAQMQEWLHATLGCLHALSPTRVLEIGCGTGLVLQHLAALCSVYVALDLSALALARLKNWIKSQADLKHVELLHRSAAELQDLPDTHFDTVILNSVVQYFPDIDYLLATLKEAVRLLRPGGRIFIGDVKHLGLLPLFHTTVQLPRAERTTSLGELKKRIRGAIAQDRELAIDPELFQSLPGRLPGISRAEVQLKRSRAPKELSSYRYDVVLEVGEKHNEQLFCEPLQWQNTADFAAAVESKTRARRWRAVRLHSIPNPRLSQSAALWRAVTSGEDDQTLQSLPAAANNALQFEGVDPQQFWKWGEEYGYITRVSWSPVSLDHFEVQLVDCARASQVQHVIPPPGVVKPWSAYASDPLGNTIAQKLIVQLQEYLHDTLPGVPPSLEWMLVEKLPGTPTI
jgi:SAM-dependent methyltransferase